MMGRSNGWVITLALAVSLVACGGPPDEIAHGTKLDQDGQRGFVMSMLFECSKTPSGKVGEFPMPKRAEICSCALPRAAANVTTQALTSAQNGKTAALEYVLDQAFDGCIEEKKRQWRN